jgi:hypothetical protein
VWEHQSRASPRSRLALAALTALAAPSRFVLQLRRCATCGHVGCRDNSRASAHNGETGHTVVRRFEPREEWFYDYRTGEFISRVTLAAPPSHPPTSRCPVAAVPCQPTGADVCTSDRGQIGDQRANDVRHYVSATGQSQNLTVNTFKKGSTWRSQLRP